MIKPADSDEEKEEDSDKAVAVKDDPQFTIAVTRGELCLPCKGQETFFFPMHLSICLTVRHKMCQIL